ncbi:hypothetical protein A9K66_22220 [Mesorhizobium sp. AA23]|nr:hypothetical protein A9K66_22220 [Mesorhizobium sp. AA23]
MLAAKTVAAPVIFRLSIHAGPDGPRQLDSHLFVSRAGGMAGMDFRPFTVHFMFSTNALVP